MASLQAASAFFVPCLAAVRGQHMGRFGAEFEQKRSQPIAKIRIAIDRELLAMDMRAGVSDGVDQAATFSRKLLGNLLAADA